MRFFRTDSEQLYEQTRATLDAAWGHPKPATVTCIDPAAVAPRDEAGRILLAVQDEFCTWEPASTLLPGLLDSGAVEEITRGEYFAAKSIAAD
jgi:hypothetical protein